MQVKMRIDFRHGYAEQAIVGYSPYRPLSVVSQFVDAVGTESVRFIYFPNLLPLRVDGNDSRCGGCKQGAVVTYLQTISNLNVVPAVNGTILLLLLFAHDSIYVLVALHVSYLDAVAIDRFHATLYVDAAKPHLPIFVHAQIGHSRNAWCVNDAPHHIVVDKQSLEVCHKRKPLVGAQYVEVAVVGIVLSC